MTNRRIRKATIGRETLQTGGQYPPNCSKMTRQTLQHAINSLSPSYREIVVLRDIENLSIKDAATILGLSEATVKTRLHRARLLLRDALAPGLDGCWSTGQRYQKVRPW
jgi:RNA polymerase sigma factor (sigma-70 family)